MTSNAQNPVAVVPAVEATGIRKNWGWFLALGIVQIIAGTLAIGFAFSATLASVVILGVLLLIAAAAQLATALLARDWDGFYLFLLLGFLYAVAGFLTLQHPLLAAEGLTLMLAALFLVVGLFRIAVALIDRVPSWGWLLFNGVVTVLLGLAMWRQWPESGLWAVGLLVGIELIVNGVTWEVMAVSVRKGPTQLIGQSPENPRFH
ncbi:MAG: HdeD family acid-resistance protein [Isosphaeraceae bacterium]